MLNTLNYLTVRQEAVHLTNGRAHEGLNPTHPRKRDVGRGQ
jgi:hypothetical protein